MKQSKHIKKRSLLVMLVLTIVTLGLYPLYWLVTTRREMVATGAKIPTTLLAIVPILLSACVYLVQVFVKAGYFDSASITSLANTLASLSLYIDILVVAPPLLYWHIKYCRAIAKVTNDGLSFETGIVTVVISYILNAPFIWPFLVQYNLNKVAKAPTTARA